ncbi:MAG: helix-turn-helix transcriptional regulator [Verrucomicrobiota bacterium]
MPERLIDFLHRRLKQMRWERKITQEELAEKAGMSYKYYQAVEAGRKRDLRLSTLEKIARALDLTVSELLNTQYKKSGSLAEAPAHFKIRKISNSKR